METMIRPTSYNIYKKKSAAQFTLMRPTPDENNRVIKRGAVLLEAAQSAGNDTKAFDWSNKISFALGMNDLCIMFDNPDSPTKLVHNTPGKPLMKSLEFKPGEGRYSGTYMMHLRETNQDTGENRNVVVPMTNGEYTVLLRLLMNSASKLIGWEE